MWKKKSYFIFASFFIAIAISDLSYAQAVNSNANLNANIGTPENIDCINCNGASSLQVQQVPFPEKSAVLLTDIIGKSLTGVGFTNPLAAIFPNMDVLSPYAQPSSAQQAVQKPAYLQPSYTTEMPQNQQVSQSPQMPQNGLPIIQQSFQNPLMFQGYGAPVMIPQYPQF